MDQIFIKDALIIPFWYDMAIDLVNNNIQSYYPNNLNLLELRKDITKYF